jgi:hypothetical protein
MLRKRFVDCKHRFRTGGYVGTSHLKITRSPMKLKAPDGVGHPCVAGVVLGTRNGLYEVEPEVGALLIECFGFMEVEAPEKPAVAPVRRRRTAANKTPAEE